MAELDFPADLEEFLRAKKQLQYAVEECEAGAVGLHPLSALRLATLLVNTYATPLEETDPHQGESGYLVPAVSLTASCEGYTPDFLLLWLPTENLFGNFDVEHGHLNVFPDTVWTHITKNPVGYLNSQWEPEDGLSMPFQPWPRYEFSDDENLKLVNPTIEAPAT